MILETLLSGIGGGLLRMAPELLKFFDRKNEREHERRMAEHELLIAKAQMEAQMHSVDASVTVSQMDAIARAVQEQGETARSAGWFVAALSALVRPGVTYYVYGMYGAVKVAAITMAISAGANWRDVLIANWSETDIALLTMITTFWFVGRVYDSKK